MKKLTLYAKDKLDAREREGKLTFYTFLVIFFSSKFYRTLFLTNGAFSFDRKINFFLKKKIQILLYHYFC